MRLPTATRLEPESFIGAVSSEVVATIRCYARGCTLLTRLAIAIIASGWTWWVIGIAIVLGLVVGPRVPHCCCCESKVDIAKLTVRKFADEAYPQWVAAHPGRACPVSLDELSTYMDKKDTKDPWGLQYRFRCVDGHVAVWSFGEDGKANSGDDIRSDNL